MGNWEETEFIDKGNNFQNGSLNQRSEMLVWLVKQAEKYGKSPLKKYLKH